MWIFNPSGLLMPADTPMKLANPHYTRGYRDLQVRARVKSHLENFIRERMEPLGLDYSEIEDTRGMDYDFRFYTRRSDFALAVADEIMNIDFEKFKPTAERKGRDGKPLYKDGAAYHSVLNSIWGVVARLGNPYGGKYSTTSKGSGYGSYSSSSAGYGKSTVSSQKSVGSSFGERAPEEKYGTFGSTKPTAASLASAGISPNEKPMFKEVPEDFDKDILDDREIDGSLDITSWIDEGRTAEDDEAFERAMQVLGLGEGFHLVDDDEDENDAPIRTISQLVELAKIVPTNQWSLVFTQAEIDFLMDADESDANPATGEVKDEPQEAQEAAEAPAEEVPAEEAPKVEGEFATESYPEGAVEVFDPKAV